MSGFRAKSGEIRYPGTVYSFHRPWLAAGSEFGRPGGRGLTPRRKRPLQGFEEGLGAQGMAAAAVPPERLQRRRVQAAVEKAPPIRHPPERRRHRLVPELARAAELARASVEMRLGARPGPVLRPRGQLRPDRVELDIIAKRGKGVRALFKRGKGVRALFCFYAPRKGL